MKKIVSFLVALSMVLAMVPFGVFAAGTEGDPVVITDISGAITAELTADNNCECYYTWTADKAGTLQVIAGSDNTSEAYDIVINDEVSVVYDMEGSYIMDVAADDVVNIWVYDEEESSVVFYLNFQNAAGAEDNPIYLNALENTVTISGITYYQGKFNGSTMVVTGDGAFSVVYNGTTIAAVDGTVSIPVTAAYPNMPITFAIDGEGEFKVNFEYPAGHYMNPAELVLGANTVTIEAGSEGYYYRWKAEEAGVLTVSVSGENWTYIVNNTTAGTYGATYCYNDDPVVATDSVTVSEGDMIEVVVNTFDPNNWYSTPGGTVTVTASFENVEGTSAENPIYVDFVWNEEYTEATATVTVPVGTYYYGQYRIGGMVLSINGGEGILLESAGFYSPTVFSITNNGEAAAEYTLKLTYAEGTMQNPAQLVLGENTAPVGSDGQGYNYTWTAEAAGALTITMDGDNWSYCINTSRTYGDIHFSDDNSQVSSETVLVSAGDVVTINVGTADWSAADVPFTASFAGDSSMNPILVDFIWNEEYTEATATVTVPVGTVYYGQYRIGGMVLSINGGEGVALESAAMMYPASFSITNDGEATAEYTLKLTYPVGDMSNPDTLVIGENTAVIAADSWGYYYTWTAEEDGELTITMPSDMNWSYAVGNMTTNVYGDTQWSDSDPVMNTYTVAVSKGDEIQIVVNTYDPEMWWSTPAGTLVITAAFEGTVAGDLNGDSSVDDSDVAQLLWYTLFGEDYAINGNADFTGDGLVNDADVAYLLWHTLFADDYPLN